jgi:S-adenosylmethionine:tRNA ribosyltransferase-isomerase
MRLADLDYTLPPGLIAQEPAPERSAARLFVLDRVAETHRHACVADLPGLLRAGDVLVLNDTRVIPARVRGRRPSGGWLEVLFVRPVASPDGGPGETWETLVRGRPRPGERVRFPEGEGEWVAPLGDGRWHLRTLFGEAVVAWLERTGEVPLPPYIRRAGGPTVTDRARYQTTYASEPGAVAAPTAGLHLTQAVLEQAAAGGVEVARLTLHVGPATFLPIRAEQLEDHTMGSERYVLPEESVRRVAGAKRDGRRVVAVGTTTVRALESAAAEGPLRPGPGEARLFIRPGHSFRVVDALLTNFHLPRSTLLALVAAFAGGERIRRAYDEAVRLRYRFYSFGDAMLIT